MKKIYKSYKFRIYPTKIQIELLNKHFGACRFIYNYYLNQRKESYLNNKKYINYYDNQKDLTQIKKLNEYNWLNKINSQSLQYSLRNLDISYNKFFRKQSKFPRFKSKKDNHNSFTIPQNIIIENNRLYIPKFKEGIKIKQYQVINNDNILFATISKSPTNKYYVSITCEIDYEPYNKTNSNIGVDTGIKDLAILSNGKIYKNIKTLKINLKKLKYNQRQLSKKIKGSNNRNKQKYKLNKIYEKITNIRKDHLHKVTTDIIKNHDIICIEDLAVKNIMKNHCLAQSMNDVSLGTFYSMLKYKADWNDKTVVKIDRFFPSSKTCNVCNYINQDLTLKDREWKCPICNTIHDRDINAAKNILKQGINTLNILSGSGIESDIKQKQVEALPLGKSVKSEINQFDNSIQYIILNH